MKFADKLLVISGLLVLSLIGAADAAPLRDENDLIVAPSNIYNIADVSKPSPAEQCARVLKDDKWKPGDPPRKEVEEGKPNPLNWPWHSKSKTECQHAGRPTRAVLEEPPARK